MNLAEHNGVETIKTESLPDNDAVENLEIETITKNISDTKDFNEKHCDIKESMVIANTTVIEPILNTVDGLYIENFKFFNTRYYEDRYFVDFTNNKQKLNEDILVRVHTNKLLLVSLATGNHIMQSKKGIVEISFIVNNTDRSKIKIQGKRKLGARQLEPHTILCQVRLEGDSTFCNIRAGVRGYLVEINELIKTNPDLLRTDPKGDGFLAIVMPKGPLHDTENSVKKLNLLSENEYMNCLSKR